VPGDRGDLRISGRVLRAAGLRTPCNAYRGDTMIPSHRSVRTTAVAIGIALVVATSCANAAADPNKVLRVASNDITSLDPQQGTDLYSTRVAINLFEALYE